MTEQQFININPKTIPNGIGTTTLGNCLMYYDPVNIGFNTVWRPLGLSFAYTSLNNINIYNSSYGTTNLSLYLPVFNITSTQPWTGSHSVEEIHFSIEALVRRAEWVYFKVTAQNLTFTSDPNATKNTWIDPTPGLCSTHFSSFIQDDAGTVNELFLFCSASANIEPFVEENFDNSDNNPLLSNATYLRRDSKVYEVNRYEDALVPTNIEAILSDTANPAAVQQSNYTTAGWTNARYEGSINTTKDQRYNTSKFGTQFEINSPEPPALSIKPFEAEVFDLTADTATMTTASKAERNIETLYFRPALTSGSSGYVYNTPTTASYPTVASSEIVYRQDSGRLIRLAKKKFFIIENSAVLTTNETGAV